MTEFNQNDCVVVRGFLDKQAAATISQYMEFAVKQRGMVRNTDEVTTSYSRYADPLIETVLLNSLEHIEEITERKLYPTYSYARVYLKGDALLPHVDRPSCEVSVTVNVATVGKPWKIWMKPPGKEPVACELEPGDAVVYKGCEVVHWREEAVDTDVTAQFMLHYVDQNGPHTAYKWDKRPGLGFNPETKGV
jgi:hypothetical protein